MTPLVAFETLSSRIAAPRTPVAGPSWIWARVAGPRNPSNLPLTASFDPVSTAESEPDPVTLAFIAESIATGASRALNVSAAQSTQPIPMASTSRFVLQDLDLLARRDDFLVGQAVRLSPPAV